MSQPDDPYLPPGQQGHPEQGHPQQGDPRQGYGNPQQQSYPQGYPEPSYTSGGYQGSYQQGYPGYSAPVPRGPEAVQHLLADKPPAVRTLLQVMVAGGVVSVLIGLLGLLGIDQLVAETAVELEQMTVDSGMEPLGVSGGLLGSIAVGTIVVSTVLTAGLWFLFAWLFSRGQARVLGTVLGAVNGVGTLFGLLGSPSSLELGLNLVHLGLVVGGLVLLWRAETTAWFRALAQARTQARWG